MHPDNMNLVFETVYGSTAFNLDRVGSDLDIRGIVVGPRSWYHGFAAAPEQIEHNADHVHFEIRKFFRLAVAANPTMLEILWSAPESHRHVSPVGRRLLESRSLFLSRRVADTFAGYARSQLARIHTHRQWLLEPPARPPTRTDFGLPDGAAMNADQRRAAEAVMAREGWELSTNFLDLLTRERRFEAARTHHEQYLHWQKTRNPARAALEKRYGYDTKHAMHLVRLQRMAVEVLVAGELRVRRDDRDELLAIRDGAWSFDELMAQCELLAAEIRDARESSDLPIHPDEDVLSDLCCELVEQAWK